MSALFSFPTVRNAMRFSPLRLLDSGTPKGDAKMSLAPRCQRAENLLRRTKPRTERGMHRPPVRRRVRVLACEEQRIALRFRHRLARVQRPGGHVAVRSARERIELPVVLVRCQ